jgi:phage terminase small subunit
MTRPYVSNVPLSKPLSLQQQRFVHEYLVDEVATAAARRAGYSGKRARWQACDLMKNPRVKAAIAAAKAARDAPLTREQAIEGLRRIASANVLDYARPGADGALELDLWRLERDRAGAVRELTVVEVADPRSGAVTRTVGFKLADRSAALMKLLPMLGSGTEAEAERRGWLAGAERMAEMPPEQFGRFQAFRAAMARGRKGAAIDAVLDAFWAREEAGRLTARQAAADKALAAREAELDELAERLDAEWDEVAAERDRLVLRGREMMEQQAAR